MATIRHVETFSISLSTSQTSNTTTLSTTLNATTAAMLFVSSIVSSANAGEELISVEITNTTTITAVRAASGSAVTVKGFVVEWTSGYTVLHGTEVNPADGDTVDISGTITDITAAFVRGTWDNAGNTLGSDDMVSLQLSAPGGTETLTFEGGAGGADNVRYQVAQGDNISVTRGETSIGALATTATVSGLSSVDTGKTFLSFSYGLVSAFQHEVDEGCVNGLMTSATALEFQRNAVGESGMDELYWERVEFTDNTTVEEVTTTMAATDSTNDETITAVDLDNAVAFPACLRGNGRGSFSSSDNWGDAFVTTELPDTTTCRLTRAATSGSCVATAYVVDFDPGAAGFVAKPPALRQPLIRM